MNSASPAQSHALPAHSRWNPLVVDTVMAGALALFAWGQSIFFSSMVFRVRFIGGPPPGGPGPRLPEPVTRAFFESPLPQTTLIGVLLIGLAFLPLALRRRYPLAVLAVATIATAGYEFLHQPPTIVVLAPIIALYTVGTLYERWTLVAVAVATAAVSIVGTLPDVDSPRWIADVFRVIATMGAAAALGDATRNRRAYIAEVEQRAVEAERSRDEEARRRVGEERLRIARELHDVTAHSLSIIAVQSGAASRVVESDSAAAKRSLESIRSTSREALEELRAMLGVLRGTDEDAEFGPAPRLDAIETLASAVGDAGLEVVVDADFDELDDIPTVVQTSAYRIVQESLTNVVRHAGATKAAVRLAASNDSLAIDVVDDGRGVEEPLGEGHGIGGMRERVHTLGGTFSAGPEPGGGFGVHATIPLARR
ncbi:MAG: sensor histidine kinase [Coriobacteriales bacterium]|nr:sensor histidine kinase [Coriobacteriales bacterium]